MVRVLILLELLLLAIVGIDRMMINPQVPHAAIQAPPAEVRTEALAQAGSVGAGVQTRPATAAKPWTGDLRPVPRPITAADGRSPAASPTRPSLPRG